MEKINSILVCALIWCSVLLSMWVVRTEPWNVGTPESAQPDSLELYADTLQEWYELEPEVIDTVIVSVADSADIDTIPHTVGDTIVVADSIVRPVKPQVSAGLDAFIAALQSADSIPVRVVHYGDSQIEEDRITGVLRHHLQQRYGGHGIGLIPLHQTIPSRSIKQRLYINGEVQAVGGGPTRYLAYGPRAMRRDTNLYGPMAQVAVMCDSLVAGSEHLELELTLLRQKNYTATKHDTIRLIADSGIVMEKDTLGRIHLDGRGSVYGLSLEGSTGVYVDNIPMRGSLGTVFTEMDENQLRDYYRETNARLIIMQYGGNFIAGTKTEAAIYNAVRALRSQIRRIRRLVPESSILFIGPSDMLVNSNGEFITNPLVPLMDSLLTIMAREEHIAYYSLYQGMGGEGSMAHWQEVGLAGSDGVHFTRAGADRAGENLWRWIEKQLPVEKDTTKTLEGDTIQLTK